MASTNRQSSPSVPRGGGTRGMGSGAVAVAARGERDTDNRDTRSFSILHTAIRLWVPGKADLNQPFVCPLDPVSFSAMSVANVAIWQGSEGGVTERVQLEARGRLAHHAEDDERAHRQAAIFPPRCCLPARCLLLEYGTGTLRRKKARLELLLAGDVPRVEGPLLLRRAAARLNHHDSARGAHRAGLCAFYKARTRAAAIALI